MTIRVGINGFGRIGRTFVRRALEQGDIEVVAVNDITDARTLAHLLEFDSTYGRLSGPVEHTDDSIIVDGKPIAVLSRRDPAQIDWGGLGVDVVVESTGKFRGREEAALHLKGGARKVLLSAPGKGADLTVVVGVNDGDYDPQRHDVISNASCTTNCVAPMAKVLDDAFGLEQGLMTTVHAYTGDQMLLDGPHKDLRRARSAASASCRPPPARPAPPGEVIPELAGRLDGVAVRVPVEDGSLTDLTAVLGRDVTAAEVNAAFEQAAAGPLAGILGYSTDPLVSRDIIGDPASCVFDSGLTQAAGQPGQGLRLVRQRMGLHLPARRPGRPRRRAALGARHVPATGRRRRGPHAYRRGLRRAVHPQHPAVAVPGQRRPHRGARRPGPDALGRRPRGPRPAPELRRRPVQPQARDPHAGRQAADLAASRPAGRADAARVRAAGEVAPGHLRRTRDVRGDRPAAHQPRAVLRLPIPGPAQVQLEQAAAAEFALLRMLNDRDAALVLDLAAAADKALQADFGHQVELSRWIATGGDDGIPAGALAHRPGPGPGAGPGLQLRRTRHPAPGRRYEPSPRLAVLSTARDQPGDWLRSRRGAAARAADGHPQRAGHLPALPAHRTTRHTPSRPRLVALARMPADHHPVRLRAARNRHAPAQAGGHPRRVSVPA